VSPQEAKRVLDLLAKGVDPETGEVLPPDHVLNSPSVIRALFLGAQALANVRIKAEKSNAPKPGAGPKAGKPWTPEEERRLVEAFERGASIEQMSEAHGRSKGGIAARLVRLGKIDERSEMYVRDPRPQSNDSKARPSGAASEV
jgi:hypothetical protein